MNTPAANLTIMTGKQFACIRITGRANFTLSIDFKLLVTELCQRGFSYFVIELSECSLMDSTFLGVLAGFGLKMTPPDGAAQSHRIELQNPNARITELLETLGVLHLFKLSQGPLPELEAVNACSPEPSHPSRVEFTQACLEAHRTLMAINPENVARFKDVAKFLAEDLQKQQAES